MAKQKIFECHNCGCDRKFLVKADLTTQDGENRATYSFYRLCLKCLLGALNSQLSLNMAIPESERKAALRCVSEDIGEKKV